MTTTSPDYGTNTTSLIGLKAARDALTAVIDLIDRSAELDEVRTELVDVITNIDATVDRTYLDPTRQAGPDDVMPQPDKLVSVWIRALNGGKIEVLRFGERVEVSKGGIFWTVPREETDE